MATDVLRLAEDGECFCRLIDPATGPVHVPIRELTSQGSLLGTKLAFQPNDYIDVALHLRGVSPRPLFAHVVGVEKDGLRVRWLHFDPSDEPKLRQLLDSFRAGNVKAEDSAAAEPPPAAVPSMGEGQKQGTRRIVRPSTVFTPFSGPPAPGAGQAQARPAAAAPSPSAPSAAAPATKPADGSERQGTRRVVRPSASSMAPAPEAPAEGSGPFPLAAPPGGPVAKGSRADQVLDLTQIKRGDSGANRLIVDGDAGHAPGEGSGGHLVIAPTARFEKMKDERAESPQSTELPGQAKVVIGQDGKLDIGATIRNQSKTVRASELAARHEKVRVLNMATIKALIQDAVGEAVQYVTASMGDAERKRLLEEAEAGFQERLKAFQAEKLGAEAKTKELQHQLQNAQRLLDEERKRTIKADQFTVSEAGLGEIEDKMRRLLDRMMREGNASPELQEQFRAMVSHVLDSEREKIKQQELEAQNAKIDLLEKKIKRLAGTLEETEKQRDEAQEMARALEQAGGGALRNVMTAGIKDSDGNKKRKLALMKEILEINRKMREELGIQYQRDDTAVAKVDAEIARLPDAPPPSAQPEKPAHEPGEPVEEPAAAAADASAEAGDAAAEESSDDGAAGGEEIDPDDMVWEVKPIQVASDEERDEKKVGGVKRISATAVPPPRQAKAAAGADDTAAAGGEGGVDPDDAAWESRPIEPKSAGGVKKISASGKEPPPLERRG